MGLGDLGADLPDLLVCSLLVRLGKLDGLARGIALGRELGELPTGLVQGVLRGLQALELLCRGARVVGELGLLRWP